MDDRLRMVFQIPQGDRNFDMEIEATDRGITIDEYDLIPWDWILEAALLVGQFSNAASQVPPLLAPQPRVHDTNERVAKSP